MRNNYGPLRPNIYVNSRKWNVNTLCLPRKLCHSRNNLSCFPLYYIKYLYNSVAAVLLIHLFPQVSISNLLLQRKPRKSWCLCNNLPSSVTWFWIGHHDTGLLNTFLRSFVTSRYASGWGCKAQTQVGLHLPWQRLCPSPHTASLGSVENALFLILLLTVSYTDRKFYLKIWEDPLSWKFFLRPIWLIAPNYMYLFMCLICILLDVIILPWTWIIFVNFPSNCRRPRLLGSVFHSRLM